MGTAELRIMTAEEYLAWENKQETKHEFLNGMVYDVYGMTGACDTHVTVTLNVASLLRNHLRGSSCRIYISDMKLQVKSADAFFYPDIFVTCDDRDRTSDYHKSFAKLIVEVLSPSTADYDRGSKFAAYRKIESFQEYVLIDTARRSIDLFRLDASGHWVLYPSEGEATVEFASVGLTVAMADIFEDVGSDIKQTPHRPALEKP